MAANMLDSMLYRNAYSTEEMRTIFDDRTIIQNFLDIEKALAQVQGEMGIIPKEAADEICKKGFVENLDIGEIEAGIVKVGHSLVPILRNFQKKCDSGYGEYIHLGATTQDILDTGFMMSVKRGFEAVYRDALEAEEAVLDLVDRYADTVMAGRTHGQQAIPITFGYKAAVWASELRRDIERMEDCRKRCFVGQLSGAVGSMAGFGENGREISRRVIEALGLDVPDISWHVSRDRLAEIVSVLATLGCTFGKIGQEIVYLQGTETGEAAEGFVHGAVGSSTMPHKRNPFLPGRLAGRGRIAGTLVMRAMQCLENTNERDCRTLCIEPYHLKEICCLADGTLDIALELFGQMEVHEDQIGHNLEILQGLIYSEALMMRLAEGYGRMEAHELVYELAMAAIGQKRQLKELALADSRVTAHLTEEELENLMRPEHYTGLAEHFVDQVAGTA